MKKSIFSVLIAVIALILCSCGGPDKAFNKQYNIKDGHPMTKKAIELVKTQQLEKEMPGYKIVKYTDLSDLDFEGKKLHLMHIVIKHNGNTENYEYYFNDDVTNCSKKLEYVLHPEMFDFQPIEIEEEID